MGSVALVISSLVVRGLECTGHSAPKGKVHSHTDSLTPLRIYFLLQGGNLCRFIHGICGVGPFPRQLLALAQGMCIGYSISQITQLGLKVPSLITIPSACYYHRVGYFLMCTAVHEAPLNSDSLRKVQDFWEGFYQPEGCQPRQCRIQYSLQRIANRILSFWFL